MNLGFEFAFEFKLYFKFQALPFLQAVDWTPQDDVYKSMNYENKPFDSATK